MNTAVDLRKLIHKHFAPSSLEAPNGDTFPISWQDGDVLVDDAEQDADVVGRYAPLSPSSVEREMAYNIVQTGTEAQSKTDNTYDQDVDVYAQDHTDIDSITQVTDGTTVFVEGTDYELFAPDDVTYPNSIRWLPGGSTPAHGVSFQVDYVVKVWHQVRSVYVKQPYRFFVRTRSVRNGTGPATQDYHHVQLSELLSLDMHQRFLTRVGEDLAEAEGLSPSGKEGAVVADVSAALNAGSFPGDNFSQSAVDVEFEMHRLVEIQRAYRYAQGGFTVSPS